VTRAGGLLTRRLAGGGALSCRGKRAYRWGFSGYGGHAGVPPAKRLRFDTTPAWFNASRTLWSSPIRVKTGAWMPP